MSLNLRDIVGNIFHHNEEESEENEKDYAIQQLANNYLMSNQNQYGNRYNPFLKKDGSLFNPYLNYQSLLNSNNVSDVVKGYIQQATGLSPTVDTQSVNQSTIASPTVATPYTSQSTTFSPKATTQNASKVPSGTVNYNANVNTNNLASLDVVTELPKLSESQIAEVIKKHFPNSTVIKPSDAAGVYNAQQQSGMSALAILAIGGLESGYGTSSLSKRTNNIWGWNAKNGQKQNTTSWSDFNDAALGYAQKYINTYYNGYGAKSIYDAGTGNNPSGKGYAYHDDGSVEKEWASNVGSIMNSFYRTATGTQPADKYPKISAEEQKSRGIYPSGQYQLGEYVADIHGGSSGYNYNAKNLGHCVWYVRGRAKQKLGAEATWLGNGNQQCANAPKNAQVAVDINNLRGDMFASFQKGTSATGQWAGHVVYIEDVVGDYVYFTDGGRSSSGKAYNNVRYTGGRVRRSTKADFMEGIDSETGRRFGTTLVGLADVTKFPGYKGPTISKTATKSTVSTQAKKIANTATGKSTTKKSSTSKTSTNKSTSKTTSNKSTSGQTKVSTQKTQAESDARSSSREMDEWVKSKKNKR